MDVERRLATLARVQTLLSGVIYVDPAVYDWPHIQAPTLVYGGAEDMLPDPARSLPPLMTFLKEGLTPSK